MWAECVVIFSPQPFLICPYYKLMQVTVAHINATAKNAADDKLRQSLRRFANTHTAPATVVLVSSKYENICSFQLNALCGSYRGQNMLK